MPAQKKGAPKGQKAAKGGKAQAAAPKKDAKAGKKAAKPAPAKEASKPRAESKGAKILELIGRPKGASLAEIHEGHGLAGPQRTRFPLDRRQEARPQDRVHEDRGRRPRVPDQKIGLDRPATSRRPRGLAAFFVAHEKTLRGTAADSHYPSNARRRGSPGAIRRGEQNDEHRHHHERVRPAQGEADDRYGVESILAGGGFGMISECATMIGSRLMMVPGFGTASK